MSNYRATDVTTPPELMALLNDHNLVDAVEMQPEDFKDWDELARREDDAATKEDSRIPHLFC